VLCSSAVAGELLIVHNSPANEGGGIQLDRATVDSSEIASSTVAQDLNTPSIGITPFSSTPSHFGVFQTMDGVWHKGSFAPGDESIISAIDPSLVPERVDEFVISHDGNKIAWVVLDRSVARSELSVIDLTVGRALGVLMKSGYILYPAWSPDDSALAYYSAPQARDRVSDCALIELELGDGRLEQKELAPESLPCMPNLAMVEPRRTIPPLWSPNGNALLFQAAYEQTFRAAFYCVSAVSPAEPRKLECLGWYRDGEHVLTFMRSQEEKVSSVSAGPDAPPIVSPKFGTGSSQRQLAILNVGSALDEMVLSPTKALLLAKSRYITCSPDGQRVAFIETIEHERQAEVSPGQFSRYFEHECERAWEVNLDTGVRRMLFEAFRIHGIWWIE
jgi:hypothetical protein